MMHFQQFLWHFLNVFFAATFSKQMIRNIIGDVICLQRLQIIGADRLEAGTRGVILLNVTCKSWLLHLF